MTISKYSPFAQSIIESVQSELMRLACKRNRFLEERDKAAAAEEAAKKERAETVGIAGRREQERIVSGALQVRLDMERKLMACDKEAGDLIRGTGAEFRFRDGNDEARTEARDALWDIYLGEAADHAWYRR